MRFIAILSLLFALSLPMPAGAESKSSDYPGVSDPFADPAQYEFSDEEKEDKEFFHLGRYMMLGLDMGAAIFTSGLGLYAAPGFLIGGNLVYFFDKAFAFEGRATLSDHSEIPTSSGGTQLVLQTSIAAFTGGFRFYFDTKAAPRAIAIANPYLAMGAGVYNRNSTYISGTGTAPLPSTNFGAYGGGGIQFMVYRNHVYLGADLRYHLVFFNDETGTLGGLLQQGERGGDYMTATVTATYSF